jgi:multiple sugar transport system ATP-binding protein
VAQFIGSPPLNLFRVSLRKDDGISVKTKDLDFNVPSSLYAKLKGYNKKEILFGVRPTDLFTGDDGGRVKLMESKVDFTEKLGTDTYLYFTVNEIRSVARIAGNVNIDKNSSVSLFADENKIFFFDSESGASLV